MKEPVDPQTTSRAAAFSLWMSSPMPMVTLTKTLDITHLVRLSMRYDLSLNMLLCHVICKAASPIPEFFILPENGLLYRYDSLAVNVIVPNKDGGINSCDIPFSEDVGIFGDQYQLLTRRASETSTSSFLPESMIIGTSALISTEIDTIVNQYTDKFLNPMVMWAKYRRKCFRYYLPISFQFHHVQMDGMHGAKFLDNLQKEISEYEVQRVWR